MPWQPSREMRRAIPVHGASRRRRWSPTAVAAPGVASKSALPMLARDALTRMRKGMQHGALAVHGGMQQLALIAHGRILSPSLSKAPGLRDRKNHSSP